VIKGKAIAAGDYDSEEVAKVLCGLNVVPTISLSEPRSPTSATIEPEMPKSTSTPNVF